MNLYISDLHLGHSNIIGFDHRPFSDVEEMDRVLIELWNGRVSPDDEVYIIGDLCYRSSRSPEWYLKQLKGHKVLVKGNHDGAVMGSPEALRCLEGVHDLLEIKDEDRRVVLCHYPIANWNGLHRGSWHVYGHIHNKANEAFEYMKTFDRALNAGCMINSYTPASFKELIENNERFKNQINSTQYEVTL